MTFQLFVDNRLLDFAVEMVPNGFRVVNGVEQENRAVRRAIENPVFLHKRELVAADELRVAHKVRGADCVGAEAQVRYGYAAALLRVVNKIRLREVGGFVADNLNRVLVGADSAVGAEPVEYRAKNAGIVELERFVV